MKLLHNFKHLSKLDSDSVVTVGNFDGVHLGHQALLKALREKANSLSLPLVVVLFEPQPREYFNHDNALPRISTLREKIELLKQGQVDIVCCLKFNRQLSQTEPEDFVKYYLLDCLKCKYLLVGNDFRFGNQRRGDVKILQSIAASQSSEAALFSDIEINNKRISSTRIRELLAEGDLKAAEKLLGHAYTLCGRVIKGDGRGRQWGIPTANIKLNRKALALKGVFCVKVIKGDAEFFGVANLGSRPTVDGTKNSLEIHLLNFEGSLYGELLQVVFLQKLRNEMKFSSIDALIQQIRSDIAKARNFFKTNNDCRVNDDRL